MANGMVPQVVARFNQGNRAYQEDSVYPLDVFNKALINRDVLLIVADGAGGHAGGQEASQTAVWELLQSYEKRAPTLQVSTALYEAVEHANRAIRQKRRQNPERAEMATTVVALALRGTEAVIAHVGDSRAYRYRNGRVELLTRDHTLVNRQVQMGQLSEAQAQVHPLRNRLSYALGSEDQLPIVVWQEGAVQLGERYLLCSDGLYNALSGELLGGYLAQNVPLEQIADSLMAAALPQATDNISFVLMEMMAGSSVAVGVAPAAGAVPPLPTAGVTASPEVAAVPAAGGETMLEWGQRWQIRLLLMAVGLALLVILGWILSGGDYFRFSSGDPADPGGIISENELMVGGSETVPAVADMAATMPEALKPEFNLAGTELLVSAAEAQRLTPPPAGIGEATLLPVEAGGEVVQGQLRPMVVEIQSYEERIIFLGRSGYLGGPPETARPNCDAYNPSWNFIPYLEAENRSPLPEPIVEEKGDGFKIRFENTVNFDRRNDGCDRLGDATQCIVDGDDWVCEVTGFCAVGAPQETAQNSWWAVELRRCG